MRYFIGLLLVFSALFAGIACRTRGGEAGAVTVALSDKFSGLDTLSTTSPDAAADRVRNLIYNSLVKKNEKFEYVGDLARELKIADDGLSVTFTLPENVKFHDGKTVTSADVKYTLDALFQAGGYKSGSFYDTAADAPGGREAHITGVETPDARTLVIRVRRPALVNQLLANLVAIPIISEGTIEQQKTAPVGTGAFKFVRFDQMNNLVELAANPDYWEGAPKIQKLNIRTVTDANALQAELQSGRVDLVPNPTNFSADTFKSLGQNPNLQIVQTPGSNVRYIGFNVQNKPLNNAKLRQAIAYAVDREGIIRDLLSGQAQVAHSIIPEQSWAYAPGVTYAFDPNKARQLLQESGYKGEKIVFKVAAGNNAVSQYAQVIKKSLNEIGVNVEIETLENNTLLEQLSKGQFEMNTSIWVGGNQDPIFLRDLFASNESPERKKSGRNRSRYSNAEFDRLVSEAVNSTDREKARDLYRQAQEIIARDLPLFPLWYPSNMVVAAKRLGNININPSGDWSFIKDVSISQ